MKAIRVRIKFEKFLHRTGKAILIRVHGVEHWIPSKLCRNLVTNQKLGGHVSVPAFIADRIGYQYEVDDADMIIEHHVPSSLPPVASNEIEDLLK